MIDAYCVSHTFNSLEKCHVAHMAELLTDDIRRRGFDSHRDTVAG